MVDSTIVKDTKMLGFKSEIGMRGRAARDQVISSKEEEM